MHRFSLESVILPKFGCQHFKQNEMKMEAYPFVASDTTYISRSQAEAREWIKEVLPLPGTPGTTDRCLVKAPDMHDYFNLPCRRKPRRQGTPREMYHSSDWQNSRISRSSRSLTPASVTTLVRGRLCFLATCRHSPSSLLSSTIFIVIFASSSAMKAVFASANKSWNFSRENVSIL